MSKERECTMALRELVGNPNHDTFVATVTKVDGAVCTVERITDLKEFTDVRLNVSSTEKQGIVITPKIDSDILVTTINGYDWFVSQYSEIEKITIDAKGTIVINDGKNDGFVLVKKLTDKLNAVENQCNTILSTLQSVSVALAPSGTFLFAPIFSGINPLVNTQQSEIENDKIKH